MSKSKELNTTTELVRGILKECPEARNSDNILYIKVCEKIGRTNGIDINKMSMPYFLLNLKTYHMPAFETVRRTRQKLQATYPELASDSNVEAQKMLYEEDFRKYARGYC